MERPIIEIDESKCNGCGQCILDCAEGALAIVDGKAKLISEVYCDGLGACLNCPQGALSLKIRNAPEFDEAAAMQAKLARERSKTLPPLQLRGALRDALKTDREEHALADKLASHLRVWPLQLRLMPAKANYLENADLLLAAQCSGFALPNIHADWIAGRTPIIACPKLEDNQILIDKLAAILRENQIRKCTILRMSVPCCDMEKIAREAIYKSGKDIPWTVHAVSR